MSFKWGLACRITSETLARGQRKVKFSRHMFIWFDFDFLLTSKPIQRYRIITPRPTANLYSDKVYPY